MPEERPNFKTSSQSPMSVQYFLVSDLVLKTEIFYFPFRKLHVDLLGEEFTQKFESKLPQRPQFTLFVAESPRVGLLGFKTGFELDASTYYSWSGGVLPSAQRQGVATALMNQQHEWCKKKGYSCIRTSSKNKFKNMMILNLKNGFDIIGCEPDRDAPHELKIIFEKKLKN